MKKFLKCLSIMCLALVMFLPIMLAGCAKNYTITIEVENNVGGSVYLKGADGKLVVGRNTVKQGEKFEYFVKPDTGYVISKITQDGEELEKNYDKDGAYLAIDEVTKNSSIVVTFARREWVVTFECFDDGEYKTYTTKKVMHQSVLDLTNDPLNVEGAHWYVVLSNGRKQYLENGKNDLADDDSHIPEGFIPYTIFIGSNKTIRTDLSSSELESLINA